MGQFIELGGKVRRRYGCPTLLLSALLMINIPYPLLAGELTIRPTINMNEIVSDNIDLANENTENEYITRVIPGIIIDSKGGGLSLSVDYAWENLFYAKNTSNDNSYNKLRANAIAEIEKNAFYLNASGTIRQQVINSENKVVFDNINPAARSNVTTYVVGPTFRNHFGTYADSNIDFRFGKVDYTNTNQLSDSDILRLNMDVTSGTGFGVMGWDLNYTLDKTRRAVGDKTKLESITADLYGQTSHRINILARSGFLNDDIQSVRGVDNGYFFSLGLSWAPNSDLTMDATYGTNNEDFNITYNPTQRTALQLSYLNRDVGANPGSRWTGLFHHEVRHFSWDISYSEDTTNLQLLELSLGPSRLVNIGGTEVNLNEVIFRPTDEDFVIKTLRFGFAANRAKSTLQLNASREMRDFKASEDQDKFYSCDILWDWRFAARSSIGISGGFFNRHFSASDVDDVFWYTGATISRQFRPKINGDIGYRYIDRNSEGSSSDYKENRLEIGLSVQF